MPDHIEPSSVAPKKRGRKRKGFYRNAVLSHYDRELKAQIEYFITRTGVSPSRIGKEAVNSLQVVHDILHPERQRHVTEANARKLIEWMKAYLRREEYRMRPLRKLGALLKGSSDGTQGK